MEKLTLKDIELLDKLCLEHESFLSHNKEKSEALFEIAKTLGEASLGDDLAHHKMFNEVKRAFEERTIHEPEHIRRLRTKLLSYRDEILTTIPEANAKTN